ncbi:hypothetical protein AJ78_04656 [Emergomyces pasteurianus Ep9510]|uniref:Uncharacterized protein n=1 Tax=Emergomyces pasteurianus Ep9510 TaxID=1447872 RepID=A0A1J9PGF4_9EURO|nr:hypothetical protein AJ78_04656 [Emergomyces pasteurianus Ep9510]
MEPNTNSCQPRVSSHRTVIAMSSFEPASKIPDVVRYQPGGGRTSCLDRSRVRHGPLRRPGPRRGSIQLQVSINGSPSLPGLSRDDDLTSGKNGPKH